MLISKKNILADKNAYDTARHQAGQGRRFKLRGIKLMEIIRILFRRKTRAYLTALISGGIFIYE